MLRVRSPAAQRRRPFQQHYRGYRWAGPYRPSPHRPVLLRPYAATYNNRPAHPKDVTGSGTAADPYTLQAGARLTSIPNYVTTDTYVQITGSGMLGCDLGNGHFNTTGCTIAGQGVCIYMNSGDWSSSGTGTIMCATFNNAGTASGSFSGMTSTPLAGFAYFQPVSNESVISITGNGGFSISGTVYAPNALVDAGGNGASSMWLLQVSRMMKAHGTRQHHYNGPPLRRASLLIERSRSSPRLRPERSHFRSGFCAPTAQSAASG